MAKVLFEHVTKVFGDVKAIDGLSLEVADGEFLVLVGPSGCGKSTALRMLAGLDSVTTGGIYIGDKRVNDVPARERDIAMVFQSYALYPHMSVFENMAFGLRLKKVPRTEVERRVGRAADILGIENLLRRKPGQLSGGQRQRVALGRAIVREPAVFLLDEPLSNLDAKLRIQTRSEISKLHERLGTTFIYVTHDQVEAMTMATRIAVLREGVLQQVGSPRDLYEKPRNIFVAGFIGSPAMNFFEATVVPNSGRLALDAGDFRIEPGDQAPLPAPLVGKTILVGVRPEDIHDPEFIPSGVEATFVKTEVDLDEVLGSDTYLYLTSGSHRFVARVDARTRARRRHGFTAAINLGRLHLFDPQTEAAIEHGL